MMRAALRMLAVAFLLSAALLMSGGVRADDLPVPARQVLNGPADVAAAARTYAAFWNTGDPAFAQAALAADFVDRTLPPGRPQGRAGPLQLPLRFAPPCPTCAPRSRS
jgi:hypothetical protein